MAGTKKGGIKAAQKNKMLHGSDFYSRIGRKGGSVEHPETRPFAKNHELAVEAGRKGGSISKRKKAKK